jgi:Arc/MetJ-type ribon-helix-helix transcriptional regulator
MIVNLTPDQKAFFRDAIASGRLHREEGAMREALALWERRERTRTEILAAVFWTVEDGIASAHSERH